MPPVATLLLINAELAEDARSRRGHLSLTRLPRDRSFETPEVNETVELMSQMRDSSTDALQPPRPVTYLLFTSKAASERTVLDYVRLSVRSSDMLVGPIRAVVYPADKLYVL